MSEEDLKDFIRLIGAMTVAGLIVIALAYAALSVLSREQFVAEAVCDESRCI